MRNSLIMLIAAFVAVAGVQVNAQTFTDIDTRLYAGKTAQRLRAGVVDANFAKLEAGAKTNSSLVVSGTTDLNGATTTTNITVDAGATVSANNGTVNLTNSTLSMAGTTVSGAVTHSGAQTTTGNASFSGTLTLTATSLNATNNHALTVAAPSYVILGIGQADNFTNTITLVAPAAAGQSLTLMVGTASSNLIAIADSGTVAASGAIELDFNDVAEFMAVDTSTWLLVSESDN